MSQELEYEQPLCDKRQVPGCFQFLKENKNQRYSYKKSIKKVVFSLLLNVVSYTQEFYKTQTTVQHSYSLFWLLLLH